MTPCKDYLPNWLENVHKDKLRISTYALYQRLIKVIIEDLGEIWLQKLTPEQVSRFYTKKLNEGMSSKYVHNLHGVLRVALETAVAWGYVPRNVCDLVKPPKIVSREATPLTVDQAKTLLIHAKGHRIEVLLTMAIVTGMRRGELLALRWSSVDLECGIVVVLATVDAIPEHGFVENAPKTKTGRRAIHIPPFLVEMLKEHKAKQESQRLKVGDEWENRDLVFTDLHGGYFRPEFLLKIFRKMLKNAGLPRIHFHDLRHSAATILLSMGVNVKVIQELLGHSNISMTLGTYSHLLPSMQEGAAAAMNNVFTS